MIGSEASEALRGWGSRSRGRGRMEDAKLELERKRKAATFRFDAMRCTIDDTKRNTGFEKIRLAKIPAGMEYERYRVMASGSVSVWSGGWRSRFDSGRVGVTGGRRSAG
jgi:hypothetical protein